MDDWSLPKPRLALLLQHFAAIEDVREPWRVAYPLREVLFLAVCATIANCDDYEDIVDWGEANLKFLRGFSDYHFGIPCADWLRSLMNRIDPRSFPALSGPGSPIAGRAVRSWWRLTARHRGAAITRRPARDASSCLSLRHQLPSGPGPGGGGREGERDHRHPQAARSIGP